MIDLGMHVTQAGPVGADESQWWTLIGISEKEEYPFRYDGRLDP